MVFPLGIGIGNSIPIPEQLFSSPYPSLTKMSKCGVRDNMRCQWLGHPIRSKGLKRSPKHFHRRCAGPRAGLEELFHNQVLVAAGVASVIGQLSKPVASAALGKGLDWRLIVKSGGMPSAHSASVVAAAAAIGLERGFSDSLFGFSVVIAGLVMYDAQGVRRAVGKQAEVINMMVISDTRNPVSSCNNQISSVNGQEPVLDSRQRELTSLETLDSSILMSQISVPSAERIKSTRLLSRETKESANCSPELRISNEDYQLVDRAGVSSFFESSQSSPSMKYGKLDVQQLERVRAWRHIPLKESVGHTKVEVLVGALVGLIITLVLHWKV
eukprot:Gb_08455 [translate_table: standard]